MVAAGRFTANSAAAKLLYFAQEALLLFLLWRLAELLITLVIYPLANDKRLLLVV